MSDKQKWLEAADNLRETLEALPDDVHICGMSVHGYGNTAYIYVQILEHEEVAAERTELIPNGNTWQERFFPVRVGWISHVETAND